MSTRENRLRFEPIARRPAFRWSNGARVAVWVIPNIEYFPIGKPGTSIRHNAVPLEPDIPNHSWREYGPSDCAEFRRSFLLALLHDSIGFAACKMIRRVLGIAHVIDLEQIADPALRARAESWVLAIAERLLSERATIADTAGLIAAVRDCPAPA